ncbi:MAG TPA: thioredoxin domain-containing protein [Pirellulales bacterium]|nr:thioredoxin domain-containing protein [Pirellulales bacterium]
MKTHRFGRFVFAAVAAMCCVGCEISDVPSGPQASTAPASGTTGTGGAGEAIGPAGASRVARGRIAFVNGFGPGLELARDQQKPMLLFFTAEWCHYCHQLANEAFVQDGVVEMSRQFVCVLVDADAEPEVCREFHVRGYPTIQFLSPGGLPLNRVTGKQPGYALVQQMQAALQVVARQAKTVTR